MPTIDSGRPFLCSPEQYDALMACAVSAEHVFQTKALGWFKREEDRRNRVLRLVLFELKPIPLSADFHDKLRAALTP